MIDYSNSYLLEGTSLVKWTKNQPIIDMKADPALRLVTEIASYAFEGCTSLKKIILPNALTRIGKHAFYYCLYLRKIEFPSSLNTIEDSAFEACNSLEKIILPKNLRKVGEEVFSNCASLICIEVHPSNTAFKSYNGVLYNGQGTELIAYPQAKQDPYFEVLDSVEHIHSWAFAYSFRLKNVRLPKRLETIGQYAFKKCLSLTDIKLPDGVEMIARGLFYQCFALKSIILPKSLIIIEKEAFTNCVLLEAIRFPKKLFSIDEEELFENCPALTQIEVNSSNKHFKSDDGVLYNYSGTKLIRYPQAKQNKHYKLLQTVEEIQRGAFRRQITFIRLEDFKNNTFLTEITLPASLKRIKKNAFRLSSITEITFPEGLVEIGEKAFFVCKALMHIRFLSKTPPSIDKQAFRSLNFYPTLYFPKESMQAYRKELGEEAKSIKYHKVNFDDCIIKSTE